MTEPSDALRDRVNPDWSPSVRATITRSLAAIDLVYEGRKPSGRPAETQRERDADKAATLKSMADLPGRLIRKSEVELQNHRRQLETDRQSMIANAMVHDTPREAQLAAEARAYLRTLSPGDKLKVLQGPNASKLMQRAALEADPALINGMDSPSLHRVQEDFLQKHFPAAVASLADREVAIEHADASVRMAKDQLARTVQLPPHDFESYYSEILPSK
jgi:hypothetical protein